MEDHSKCAFLCDLFNESVSKTCVTRKYDYRELV